MTKRQRIQQKITKNLDKIRELNKQNAELEKEALFFCDKEQWFTEEIEEVKVRDGRKIRKEKWLIGKVNWKEFFKDESYPNDPTKGIWITRSEVVRVNGEWQF